ncbi:MAG: sulfite exporter TauE/SafE family protein [Burkholderiaceae bacterium]
MEISLALGLAVGIILALTGAGGGILAVPLLVFGAGLGMAQAGPIGLLAVGMAAALGALLGLRERIVRYKAALLVAAAGMLLTPAGLWLAQQLPNRPLALLFAAVLLLVALRMWRQAAAAGTAAPRTPPPCRLNPAHGRFHWTWPCARALAAGGMLTGFLSGLLGVGGGFVMVPALRRYTDLPMPQVVATSLAVIALVSFSGVASSALAGTLYWPVALPFAGGALLGMLGGRAAGKRLAGPQLQIGFAAVAALVAVGMMVSALR